MSGYGFPTYNFGQQNVNDNQYNRYMNMINTHQVKNDTNADFIIVSSIDEAKNSIMQNGQIRWFRHSSKPELYVKAVSMTGQPSFNAYRLEEFNFEQSNEQNDVNFVTMDKFAELSNEVVQLKNIITNQTSWNKSIKPSSKEAK